MRKKWVTGMERLIIGEVLKPQGIRGELKIKTFTDSPEDVKAFGTVYIDGTAYKILSFRVDGSGAAYIGLRGIPDRNAAELFRGKKIEGDRKYERNDRIFWDNSIDRTLHSMRFSFSKQFLFNTSIIL